MHVARVWVGVDAGKEAHHAAALDEDGRLLWSIRVANSQAVIAGLIGRVDSCDDAIWAVDMLGGETALLRAMLAASGHSVVYIPGRTVKAMAASFPGEAKTDARDAVVIAHTARMRRDFLAVAVPAELVATLTLLLSHRNDLLEEWVRTVNRLRRLAVAISPALERVRPRRQHDRRGAHLGCVVASIDRSRYWVFAAVVWTCGPSETQGPRPWRRPAS
jgi:transposase